MSDLFLLSRVQMRRIEPFFPRSRGLPRVDDRRVISGIVYVIRHGLQWKDAPPDYGPPKTLYNRFIRWSRLGVFAGIDHLHPQTKLLLSLSSCASLADKVRLM